MRQREDVDKKKQLFRDTIELLESIPDLKFKIEQDRMDIEDMQREKFDTNTWHDIKRPGGPQLDDETRHLQRIRNRERGMLRTEQLLERVKKALDKMRGEDDDYKILEMRYLKNMTIDQISEELHYSKQTIWRKHNKIVTKLKRKLFGADALDVRKE